MGQIDDAFAFALAFASMKTSLSRLRERLKIDGVDELTPEQINEHHSMAWMAGYNKAWDAAIRAQCGRCDGRYDNYEPKPIRDMGIWIHKTTDGRSFIECRASMLHEAQQKEEKK